MRSRRGSSVSACTAARRNTSTTKLATTAASIRSRRRCSRRSCRTLPSGAASGARTRRTTTARTPTIDEGNESIYNQYTIRADRRDGLQAHLKGKGIGSAIYYPLPLHLQPCFQYLGYREGSCPESERAAREVLSLPVYPELTRGQQDEVIGAVRSFYGH